jgi:hypothetical protein
MPARLVATRPRHVFVTADSLTAASHEADLFLCQRILLGRSSCHACCLYHFAITCIRASYHLSSILLFKQAVRTSAAANEQSFSSLVAISSAVCERLLSALLHHFLVPASRPSSLPFNASIREALQCPLNASTHTHRLTLLYVKRFNARSTLPLIHISHTSHVKLFFLPCCAAVTRSV